MSDSNRFSQTTEVLLILFVLFLILVILFFVKPPAVPLKSFTESDVLALITSIFVMAVFMERSIEAILTPIRAPDCQKIEQELEDIKRAVASGNSQKEMQIAKERELAKYRLNTTRFAIWLSFLFGLIISVAGIRTLGGLVNPEALKDLGEYHRTLFSFVDVVLTGGVIAGGSAAIDKIGRAISEFYNLNRDKFKTPP